MKVAMKMSQNGVDTLIKPSEAWRDKPYNDPAHNASIAWGHKLHDGPVTPVDWARYGQGITPAQGEAFLAGDRAWAETEVNSRVEVQLNQNQFDAIVDFVFNEGSGTFEKSSVFTHLNDGDFSEACDSLLKYEYAGGVIEDGLLTRRKKEVVLFNTPIPGVDPVEEISAE